LLSQPFDWSAVPVRFRLVRESAPGRSEPIPPPRGWSGCPFRIAFGGTRPIEAATRGRCTIHA